MPRSAASSRRDQFFEPVEYQRAPLSHSTSRQGSVLWGRKSACRPSESGGSLLGHRLTDTRSERS
jgi:hypothetical protein